MIRSRNLLLAVVGFFVLAVLLGLLAGLAYAAIAVLVGAIVFAAVAIAAKAASDGEAPFSPQDGVPLGDSAEHSRESSAVDHAPR